ncbi:hypothetical protein [Pseudoxanthomonas sp. UTMC 1351]|uniref:bestrophin-like domain n=1 Tax=Pseudoxanthomonas sp. UTMC 1351 TaxID=2695853 RepID=UPI0034CD3489
MTHYFLECMPIAGVYLCIAVLILVSCEIGFFIGRYNHRTRQDKEAPTSIGPMVGGLLGMLAFVLAFTFSMAASQHGVRKQNVLTEANAIGTAYLRADLLDTQSGAEVKRLLREYVDIRLAVARPGGDLLVATTRSLDIHDLLWAQVSSVAVDDRSAVMSLVIASINDVIDMHEQRLAGSLRARIPGSVWFGLMLIAVLTMGMIGLQIGLTGKRRLVAIVPLSLAFAVLATLVVDLNRPRGGFITVGQQAMLDLQTTMNRSAR